MGEETIKQRDRSVDVFRGIAMLLVVLGHTMSGTTKDYDTTFLFNIIWSLQMPLFMIISGYVTRYTETPSDFQSLFVFLRKRTLAYLLPWAVWTVLIRGLLLRDALFLDLGYILWHMDSGYWFLTSLWTICLIFGIGCTLASYLNKNDDSFIGVALTTMLTLFGGSLLLAIGLRAGLTFFGIKLSLYYTPFFLLGYSFGQIQKRLGRENWLTICEMIDITTVICAAVFLAVLVRFNIAADLEDVESVIIRIVASVSGCATVFGFGWRVITPHCDSKVVKGLVWFGQNSLGIYLIHSLFLCMIKLPEKAPLSEFRQFIFVLCNYTLTVILSSFFVWVFDHHPLARRALFGKKR